MSDITAFLVWIYGSLVAILDQVQGCSVHEGCKTVIQTERAPLRRIAVSQLRNRMTTVRCKFICMSKREFKSCGESLYDYQFSAVTTNSDENNAFFRWTPAGTLSVSTVRDDQFDVGAEYYLDLTPAP